MDRGDDVEDFIFRLKEIQGVATYALNGIEYRSPECILHLINDIRILATIGKKGQNNESWINV